jgi:hypothetical protein
LEPELDGIAQGEWLRSVARLEAARLAEGPRRWDAACQAFDLGRACLERWLWITSRDGALALSFHLSSCLDELVAAAGTGEDRLAEAYDRVRAFARTWSTLTGPSRERVLEELSEERRDRFLRFRLSLRVPTEERAARLIAMDRKLATLNPAPLGESMTLEQIAAALPERTAWVDASVHWTPSGTRVFAWIVRSGEPRAHRVTLGSSGETRPTGAGELAALLSPCDAVFARFAEPFDTMPPRRLAALLENERIALLDTPARLARARRQTPKGRSIEEVVVLAASERASHVEGFWQESEDGPRLRRATAFADLGPADVVHVALEASPSPGPLPSSWAWAASHASIQRNVIDVSPDVTLPWHVEAGLELPDGSTVTAAEIADLDLSGCGVVVLEVGTAGMTAGLSAVARAFLHAGARTVILAGGGDQPLSEFVAAVTAGTKPPREAARRADMAAVGDIE